MWHATSFRSNNVALLARTGTGLFTTNAINTEVALTLVAAATGFAQFFLKLADRCVAPVGRNAISIVGASIAAVDAVTLIRCAILQTTVHAGAQPITTINLLDHTAGTALLHTGGTVDPQSTLATAVTLSINTAG